MTISKHTLFFRYVPCYLFIHRLLIYDSFTDYFKANKVKSFWLFDFKLYCYNHLGTKPYLTSIKNCIYENNENKESFSIDCVRCLFSELYIYVTK